VYDVSVSAADGWLQVFEVVWPGWRVQVDGGEWTAAAPRDGSRPPPVNAFAEAPAAPFAPGARLRHGDPDRPHDPWIAVPLAQGRHRVVVSYAPPALSHTLWPAIVALVIVGAVMLIRRRSSVTALAT
jgi:hypothetical protein